MANITYSYNDRTFFTKIKLQFIRHIAFYIYLSLYTIANLLTLTIFPMIHSDEAWLSGMSHFMLKKSSLFVTEPFFDLMPRTAHSMKALFHLLQNPYLIVFGNSIFSVRLLSLTFSIITLIALYLLFNTLFSWRLLALSLTIIASTQIQFIYASHFARQEIILVFILVVCYKLLTVYTNAPENSPSNRYLIGLSMLIGLSISIHPNSFVIACMIGILLLKYALTNHNYKTILTYIGIIGAFALLNVSISFIYNPNFFNQYVTYGETLSVNAPFFIRLQNLMNFFIKLYERIGATYYLPNLKVITIIFILLILYFIIYAIISRKTQLKTKMPIPGITHIASDAILMTLSFIVATFIIGRYNSTSIVFLWLPFVLLLGALLYQLQQKKALQYVLILTMLIYSVSITISAFNQFSKNDYNHYLSEISSQLDSSSVVLGNLSAGFAFSDIPFYDIRNLAYLDTMTVDDYINKNHINTIIYYEEYDYIHRNPKWEILYENNFSYYSALNDLLQNRGTLVYTLEDYYYGTRIINYSGDYPWKVYIYKLDQ